MLNFGNLIAPVVVALCANSPSRQESLPATAPAREGRMINARYGERHGMIARPYTDLTDFVSSLSRMHSLLRRDGERLLPDGRLFSDVLRADYGAASSEEWALSDNTSDAFLLHDHYIWHSARLRTAYATVELRPACQQPPHELMAATALYLGLVEGREELTDYIQTALAPTDGESVNPVPLSECWPRMRQYHEQVVRAGLGRARAGARILGRNPRAGTGRPCPPRPRRRGYARSSMATAGTEGEPGAALAAGLHGGGARGVDRVF